MIDPELKSHLERIEAELVHMRKETVSLKASLMRGLISGMGYVLGVVIFLLLIGWVLNIVGVIPAFNNQVQEFRGLLQHIAAPIK
jgi:hypothetical protein